MTQIKQTKTKTYIKFNDEFFMTNNNFEDKTIVAVDFSKINADQSAALLSEFGWENIGEYENVNAAYYAFIGLLIQRRKESKEKNDALAIKMEVERQAAWDAIKDLEIIPSTIDNIRTVLLHLNNQNWGGWKLPKMSISYSAAQFDCDGSQASTMKLDHSVEGSKMFKVGGKPGHLSKYTRL